MPEAARTSIKKIDEQVEMLEHLGLKIVFLDPIGVAIFNADLAADVIRMAKLTGALEGIM